ncbi:MAG: hypothetical protein SGJ16_08020 [Nitrospirota bacterium]|nr:hypothetical protein [Nitrospirota bacterium]
MKTLMLHEQKRLREHAALILSLSPDTRPEILRKDISEFSKHLLSTIQRKRDIKHWQLVLVVDSEAGKP